MPLSNRYIILQSRIQQLETHLLPGIDPTLNYSDKDRDLTRAFCLLSHAEIEAYIEDIVWDVTSTAYNKWYRDKTIISPIIFHLAYSFRNESGKQKEIPYSMIVKSYQSLEKTIKKNNGIKDDNIHNILNPIGFEIDNTLKTTLHNFGKTRGQIAHTSFQTQQPLDPASEKTNINQILTALGDFDTDLSNYESTGTLNRTPVNMKWRLSIRSRILSWFK